MGVEFQLVVLDHPDRSPVIDHSHLHLFLHFKKHLASQKFHEDKEVKNKVITWLCVQAVDFYVIGIQKIVPRLNKGPDKGSDYV